MGIRKKYFVNKKIQGSYMIITSCSVLFTALSVGIAMYCLLFRSFARQVGIAKLASIDFKIVSPEDIPWLVAIFIGVLILSALTGLFFVFYTHRIVGPFGRIQSAFDSVGKGNYSVRLKLRKNDYLTPIAESFNKMVASLKEKYSGK